MSTAKPGFGYVPLNTPPALPAGVRASLRRESSPAATVPAVVPTQVVDPTGCGDAWRGALLFGLERGWALPRCAALGNRVGALKIAQRGPQNYTLDFAVE